uniref:Uncharacterized protein n=1 Tax=Octopus bimaculoides TaxID=37653 RepID=A0A0L8GZV5_OCTBM
MLLNYFSSFVCTSLLLSPSLSHLKSISCFTIDLFCISLNFSNLFFYKFYSSLVVAGSFYLSTSLVIYSF